MKYAYQMLELNIKLILGYQISGVVCGVILNIDKNIFNSFEIIVKDGLNLPVTN